MNLKIDKMKTEDKHICDFKAFSWTGHEFMQSKCMKIITNILLLLYWCLVIVYLDLPGTNFILLVLLGIGVVFTLFVKLFLILFNLDIYPQDPWSFFVVHLSLSYIFIIMS